MDAEKTDDWDEVQIFNEIRKELGISTVRFGYRPENMEFESYEVDKNQNRAILFYNYDGQIIRYSMYMNDEYSSHGQTEIDELADVYQIRISADVLINIKVYTIDNRKEDRYVAEFEYMDAQYFAFTCLISKEKN